MKPDNIGFKEDGTLKLFDFGLAVCVRVRHYLAMSYDMSGNTGSLRYMAPEVAKNLAYTEKVDVYSYGIVLWQMARESLPFAGLNKREFIKRVVEKGERPPIDPEWPPDFSRILEWCWQTDPMARPTFAVVVAEINTILMNDLDFH